MICFRQVKVNGGKTTSQSAYDFGNRWVRKVLGTTTIARHLVYDAFGNVTSDTAPAVPSLFLYTARPFDEHPRFQNNLNRWYDAQVGRWLSEDPIGFDAGDGNLYRYVGNGAVQAGDPEGLWKQFTRYNPDIWQAEEGDTFERLIVDVTAEPRSLDSRFAACIRPRPDYVDAVDYLDSETIKTDMEAAWRNKAPAPCGVYDVGNLTNSWRTGPDIAASVGNDDNGYIRGAQTFYKINNSSRNVLPFSLAGEIAAKSNYGSTPIRSLTIIGHSWNNKDSIGGARGAAVFSQAVFKLGHLTRAAGVTSLDAWPHYTNAVDGTFPPICWLCSDASVRLVGCSTSNFAQTVAKELLKPIAAAFGTSRPTWSFGKRMGWGTATARGARPNPAAGTAGTVDEYHAMQWWEAWHGYDFPRL